MQATERQVFGSIGVPTSLWVWGAQRLSGVLLGPVVIAHILGAGGPASRAALNILLLLIIVVHGYVGIRRIRMKARYSVPFVTLAIVWSMLVLAFGGLALIYA